MIVQTFLRWAETAKATDRARAANALGRAYLTSSMNSEQHRAAYMAMTTLLDDPSPRVRLALAEALADSEKAPRAIMLSLAEDQPEIACHAITRSPLLSDGDLVDLVGRGSGFTRALVAARPGLTSGAAAALAEIAEQEEVVILLENRNAAIGRFALKRIAERFGDIAIVRDLLLIREDLPADARHLLVQQVSAALAGSDLVRKTMAASRIAHVTREAAHAATVCIAGSVSYREIPALVEHLRKTGQLTPAFLIHALCSGKVDFFAGAIFNLSGLEEQRVRAILATGRTHAVRALFESAGLSPEISPVFVEATMLWRQAGQSANGTALENMFERLERQFRRPGDEGTPVAELLNMIEKLHLAEERNAARIYANDVSRAA